MPQPDHPSDRPEVETEVETETEAQRSERVRAARAARHRRWADLQVEEAMRRGDFDGLRGAGRPLDLSDRHDPNWWVKRLIAREQIDVATPPAIALRLEDERLDAVLDAEATEREVRRQVADFNRRVVDARRQLLGGPPVITQLRDEDDEVARWRARRAERRAAYAARQAAEQARPSARERRRRRAVLRLGRRRRREAQDDAGAARRDEAGRSRTHVALAAAAATALAVALGVSLGGGAADDQAVTTTAPPRPTEPADPVPSAAAATTAEAVDEGPDRCSAGRGPFRPTGIAIPGVDRAVEVVYPARGADGIPGTPPLTAEGKRQMAYDTANGIAPGARNGNALFNAHTWPDGSALGNALLRDLRVGDALRVRGRDGRTQCYRLTRRVEVPATVSGKQYYRRTGVPRMAIVVCSGDRDASGNWSHRTLFFAAPVA